MKQTIRWFSTVGAAVLLSGCMAGPLARLSPSPGPVAAGAEPSPGLAMIRRLQALRPQPAQPAQPPGGPENPMELRYAAGAVTLDEEERGRLLRHLLGIEGWRRLHLHAGPGDGDPLAGAALAWRRLAELRLSLAAFAPRMELHYAPRAPLHTLVVEAADG